MSKAKPVVAEQGSDSTKQIDVVKVHPLVIRLLKEGRTRSVLTEVGTFKELPAQFMAVSEDHADERVLLKPFSMDQVGGGYLPDGYPDGLKVRGGALRIRVEVVSESEEQPVTEAE